MITEQQVSEIATSIFNNIAGAEASRASYLRTLISATQEELGQKRGEPVPTQLRMLQAVHERFYEIILKAAQPFVPKTQKDRSTLLHARANFARTALSSVKAHIRAGEDVVSLNAARTTKAMLSKPTRVEKPMSVKRWKNRVLGQSKLLIEVLQGLSGIDKGAAVQEMQIILGLVTTQLVSLGVLATKDATQSVDEHRPLRIGQRLFVPTENHTAQMH
jgi:hypothetical protein